MTKAEQETIVRWDQDGPEADLYTAHPAQAKRWEKQGYPVEVMDEDADGTPRGWRCRVPKEAVRFRQVNDGAVVKRRTGPGRRFCATDGASEQPTAAGATPAPDNGQSVAEPAIDGTFSEPGAD